MEYNKKPKVIENKNYGFTENDVDVCEDVLQLNDWLTKVRKDINIIDGKLDHVKANNSIGNEVDPKWVGGLKHARKIQKTLEDMIIHRISSLKENNKETYQFEVNFVEEAKKELDEELFNKIANRAAGYPMEDNDG